MTYLELVNDVLIRMREDTIDSIGGSSQAELGDPVAYMVKQFVNDAKRMVEDSHAWNALRDEWVVVTSQGTPTYPLTGSGGRAVLDAVYSAWGGAIREATLNKIRKDSLRGGENTPMYYAIDGTDANGDARIRLSPTPKAAGNFHVYGFKYQDDLQKDTDVLKVPHKPVVYYALALAARERGEVGGQTSTDIFGLAKNYLSDAIALDAASNSLDDIWVSV
jgi:hypothetical protein